MDKTKNKKDNGKSNKTPAAAVHDAAAAVHDAAAAAATPNPDDPVNPYVKTNKTKRYDIFKNTMGVFLQDDDGNFILNADNITYKFLYISVYWRSTYF